MAIAYRSNRVRDIVTIGIVGLLGLAVATLYYQLDNLKSELKAELAAASNRDGATDEKVMSLQREMDQIRQDQSSAASMLARLEDRSSIRSPSGPSPLSPPPTSSLNNTLPTTAVENKLIREFLEKVNGLDPIVEAGYKIGDKIPTDRLLDFSVLLTEKVPALKNTKYTIDQKSSIIIVSEENRVVALLTTAK